MKFRIYDFPSIFMLFLLIGIVVFFKNRIPNVAELIYIYSLLLLLIGILSLERENMKILDFIHTFYPILTIFLIFNSLGKLIECINPKKIDTFLINLDYKIFKVHPTVYLEKFINPLTSNVFYAAYLSYYFMPLLACLPYLSCREKFDKALFFITVGYYLSFIGYILFPAIGPRFTLEHLQTKAVDITGFSHFINHILNFLENTKTDAFPSGHTDIALLSLYVIFRYKKKWLGIFLTPVVILLIISTVFCRYHYVSDVIAGIIFFVVTVAICEFILIKCKICN